MTDDLPQGWATTTLAELLVALESGSRPRGGVRGIAEGVPSIGGEHLNYNGAFNLDSIKYVPREFATGMTKGRIQCNDILIVKDGATTGKTAFVDARFPFENAVVNEHVFICRATPEIEARFLFRFLMSKEGQERILENFKGSAQGGINQSFAPNTEVPLAPFAEQRRIVAKLEKVLGQVDVCQQRLAKIPVLLKRFRQAILAAACSGRLTADWRTERGEAVSAKVDLSYVPVETPFDIPGGWKWIKWGGLAAKEKHSFKRGPFGSALKKEIFVANGYKVYEQCNPINDDCSLGNYYITQEKFKALEAFKVSAGDLLISCSGVTLGRITQVPQQFEEGVINQALLKVALNKELIRSDYFINYFRSTVFQSFIFEGSQGSAQPNIKGVKELKEMPVPVPTRPEQEEIVRRVENLFALADQIEARYLRAKTHIEKISWSILSKASKGELVPQDPADEPASILLERVRKTKDGSEPSKKAKRAALARV